MTTPVAPLYMPPFDEFVAWLRATPDRVFPAKQEGNNYIGCVCPVGVYARQHNAGEHVGVSHSLLFRVCGNDTKGYVPIDGRYHSVITAIDIYTNFMSRSVVAKELLEMLDKEQLL